MESTASQGQMAGGVSQLSANGSKIGGEEQEDSQAPAPSLYGIVKAPRLSSDMMPMTSKNIEALREKLKNDVLCGSGGVVLAIVVSAAFFALSLLSFQGKVLFVTPPDYKDFVKIVDLK
ncbi:hypothetical protein L3Y34_005318 [Caenorhabditis briggsae]|uniref:Uncharacterized protein n=1 Tax=Caenorhabditis briggsae TaxID=6238 RepID=A0AAE9AED9_CAEBR|nr:hypothetical protein L3Y34_005318 [Caenorhabditis briggsae]